MTKEELIQTLRAELECLRLEFISEIEKLDMARKATELDGWVPVELFEQAIEVMEFQVRYIGENFPAPMPGRRLTLVVDNTTKTKRPAGQRRSVRKPQ